MFEVIKKNQVMQVSGVTITIYGDAGLGKTTLANTAKNAITIDFDNGFQRCAKEHKQDCVPVVNWNDIAHHMNEFFAMLEGYDTVIIDTVGSMLDYIDLALITNDPKLAIATLKKYGELKNVFSQFHRRLMTLGKDVIYIAHAKEKEENERRYLRMNITGSSYDLVVQKSDMVGYMSMINGKATIDFNPTDRKIGKNSANIPTATIGNIDEIEGFMANMIQQVKDALNAHSESQAESIAKIDSLIHDGMQAQSIDALNAYVDVITTSGLIKAEKLQVWNKFKKHAESLGYEYNAKSKQFEDAQ
jgi:hypothetical protein